MFPFPLTSHTLGLWVPDVAIGAGADGLVLRDPAGGERRARLVLGARVDAEAAPAGSVVGALVVTGAAHLHGRHR